MKDLCSGMIVGFVDHQGGGESTLGPNLNTGTLLVILLGVLTGRLFGGSLVCGGVVPERGPCPYGRGVTSGFRCGRRGRRGRRVRRARRGC